MNTLPKRRLGRGLAALIGDDAVDEPAAENFRGLRHLPVEFLRSNRLNPRRSFRDDELDELARSIADKGILQPIVARPTGDGRTYEIVAGERRWRAAQRAGVHEVPVLVRELDDREVLEIALIENIQRADLNALEEARGYGQLIDQFGYTQQQLADAVGKSRSHIANTLRLLTLPEAVRAHIEAGELTAGHARTLVASDDPESVAQKIIKLGLSVREAEQLSRDHAATPAQSPRVKAEKSADIRAFEKALTEELGLKVELNDRGRGGVLSIRYKSLEQLDDLWMRLTGKPR